MKTVFEIFCEWCNMWMKNIILDFVYYCNLLNSPCFISYLCFCLYVYNVRQKTLLGQPWLESRCTEGPSRNGFISWSI